GHAAEAAQRAKAQAAKAKAATKAKIADARARITSRGCKTGNSFVPGTLVLMADGTAKPIEEVDLGDTVIATDPETGQTAAEPVVGLITGDGDKHLVGVTVDTDGDKGTATGQLVATDGHPFWVENARAWLKADQLQPGMWLRTSAGTHVQVTAIKTWTKSDQRVHNLTIADTHTYYVLASATPVLVHNCGTGPKDGAGLTPEELMSRAQDLRDGYAGEMAKLSNRKRPATVTAGYNVETGQYAAGASAKGVCAEVCVVNQLGGDPSKIVFTSAVRPRTGQSINICVSCEGQFGRKPFKEPGTIFDSDVLRVFDD
ncbi:polymorphic toxin-type HINT domain-containing protein, partial [Sphaerimonospora thailandensis]|uniref:polymorphic toxin-type HINT domain-containing protein n=1 Tax=Sphaerimonospora thailandensis TaxID=795644 RepID=UPI001EF312AC